MQSSALVAVLEVSCYFLHNSEQKKKIPGSPLFLTASDESWVGPGNETTFLKWSWHNRQIEKKKIQNRKAKSHIFFNQLHV